VIGAESALGSLFWFLLFVGLPLSALVSAAKTPPSIFRAANSSKALWIVPLFLGVIAAGIYWLYVQPRLKRVSRPQASLSAVFVRDVVIERAESDFAVQHLLETLGLFHRQVRTG